MRVKFTAPFDYVTLRTRSGTPRATVAYQPGEPITVKREHGEAAVAAGKAVEVDEVYNRGEDGVDGPTPLKLPKGAKIIAKAAD